MVALEHDKGVEADLLAAKAGGVRCGTVLLFDHGFAAAAGASRASVVVRVGNVDLKLGA